MKYFTYERIAAANDWIAQTAQERRRAERALASTLRRYFRHLDALRPRVSATAWQFFRHGSGRLGLHDARLLSLTVGDGLGYTPDGSMPFLLNRQRLSARAEFLNYEQDLRHTFDLRGVSRINSELFVEEWRHAKSVGDLYICELTTVDENTLQLGFLFASGATTIIRFRKLVFGRRRIGRRYAVGEIYG